MIPESILDALRDVARKDGRIRALYVFGSRAAGAARADSDLDVGVLYRERQPLSASLALAETIETAVGLVADVVDVGHAGAFVALEIVRGDRVFCRDAVETDRFELYVLRRAGDLLPFERAREALLLDQSAR